MFLAVFRFLSNFGCGVVVIWFAGTLGVWVLCRCPDRFEWREFVG